MHPNFITSTSYIIHKDNLDPTSRINLKSRLSTLDFEGEKEIPRGYYEIMPKHVLMLFGIFMDNNKASEQLGVSPDDRYIVIPKIQKSLLNVIARYDVPVQPFYKDPDEYPTIEYNLTTEPFDYQVPVITEAIKHLRNHPDKRVSITLPPGTGKTFISAKLISMLKCKFLFIVYNKDLLGQNYDNVKNFLGNPKGFLMIEKSSQLFDIDYSKVNAVFMSHSMLREYVSENKKDKGGSYIGWTEFNRILDTIGIQLKVIDEFDRESGMNYKLDMFCNFIYNIYLTGTPFKSLKPDDSIFQATYGRGAKNVGKEIEIKPNKDIIFLNCRSIPAPNEYFNIMRDEKTFKVEYNNVFGRKDAILDYIFYRLYSNTEKSLMKRLIEDGGSIVIFCGRIATCDEIKDRLIKVHNINENDIGIINSDPRYKNQFDKNKTKKFIITTTSSLGRGTDLRHLRMLIFLEFHFSRSEVLQSINRVGRAGGKKGFVLMPIDNSFTKVTRSMEAKQREGLFNYNFLEQTTLTIPEDFYKNYFYGYDKNSTKAKKVKDYMDKKARRNLKVSKTFKNMY